MAQRDQLEVVSPTGDLLFFDLDERDGVTNIGRHPSNDVVLNGEGIADFHIVIDHRTRPYQISLINTGARAVVGNQTLEPNQTYPLQPWDTILLDGFTMILVEGDGAAESTPPPAAAPFTPGPATPPPSVGPSPGVFTTPPAATPPPVVTPPPAVTPPPTVTTPPVTPPSTVAAQTPAAAVGTAPPVVAAPAAAQSTAVGAAVAVGPGEADHSQAMGAPPVVTPAGALPLDAQNGQAVHAPGQTLSDIVDDTIVLDVSAREVAINVEESATWHLTIANGGSLVARFEVHIEGWIDGSWVSIDPPFVNLYEGGRGTVTITITPPRLPTSRAGTHQLAVVVTSPNYPGLRAQRAITLIIHPYYEFHVGDVNPRQQTVHYFRRTGLLRLPVQNRGNSEVIFRIEGADDENLITFEMDSPVEETRLVRQVEFPLAPNQSMTIPISATPRNYRFVGAGTHIHSMTLTTTMLAPQPVSRSVLAQLRNRPIVGPWLIFALLAVLAAILIIALQPRIESFEFAPGVVQTTVEEGADAGGLTVQGVATQAADLQGAKIFGFTIPKLPKLPKQLAFLNNFWPGGGTEEGEAVATAPSLAAAMVEAGNEVTLTWSTRRATQLTIEKIVGGETQFVATIDEPSRQRTYTFRADLRERATYVLTAHNWIERLPIVGQTFGRDEERLGLIVDPVQPVIEVFEVEPQSLVTGQTVNISWQVARAQDYELLVNGVPRPLESARGSMQDVPQTTTEYRLVARSPYWDEPVSSTGRVVAVALPTPVINNFDIEPKPIIDGQNILVAWDVAGAANVTIDPIPGDVPNLQGQEEGRLEEGKTQQTFTLLATLGEGDQQVRAIATRIVDIVTPTPTPTDTPIPPTGTPTPTPTSTPIPTPLVRLFDVSPKPIIDGERVQVSWAVEGAGEVIIAPVPGAVNLEGQDEVSIEAGKSQETFTLRAIANDGVATAEVIATRVILIVTPTPTITPTPTETPTATPQMPVIQAFTLSPREVVRGDAISTSGTDEEGQPTEGGTTQPELTWTVIGDATDVEITGPDFGPVRNLPKQGSLRVPATETTVYQLNVYLGDEIVTSQTQELTVLEPTPTPTVPPPPTPPPTDTPTPTPTATPNIVSFTVNAVEDGDVVAPVSSDDNIPTYEVQAGTLIRLAWRIENPVTEVRLTDSSNDYGARSPEDEFQLTITQSTVFQLTVTGSVSRRIRINVLAIPPPPPPFNVNGTNGETNEDPATVTWSYPGEFQSRILGFRVYRANVDEFNFTLVADRFELDNTATSWSDPTLPSCDRVYYVVGVYEDITRTGDDRIQETAISPTSWYTRPCE